MIQDLANLEERLETGDVTRYHAAPDVPAQSIAEHSWRVCQTLLFIYPEASADCMRYALAHDMDERLVGDIPYFTKVKLDMSVVETEADKLLDRFMDSADVRGYKLPKHEKLLVDFCDRYELTIYCLRQGTRGGRRIAVSGVSICGNTLAEFRQLADNAPFLKGHINALARVMEKLLYEASKSLATY